MANCAVCGHWAGHPGEHCPHCGANPAAKVGARVPSPATPSSGAAAPRGPGTKGYREVIKDLDSSPIFAGQTEPDAPLLVPVGEDDASSMLADDDVVAIPGREITDEVRLLKGSVAARAMQRAAAGRQAAQTQPQNAGDGPSVIEDVPTLQPVAPMSAPTLAPIATLQPIGGIPTLAPVGAPTLMPVATGPALDVCLTAAFEHVSVPAADDAMEHFLLTLTPAGPPALDPSSGPVAHVILALDISASMNRTDKYPVLTEALSNMLYDLKRPGTADVLLSVVVFAYGAEIVLRDVPAAQLDPRHLLRAIDRSKLLFGRYTDAVGALSRAGRIAYDSVQANRHMPVRIFLLTDGRPQDMDGSRKIMDRIRKMPVDVEGLAFGKDADVAALQELVSGGRGGTVKQIRADTISDAFGRIAEAAATVVTNRALLDVELADGVIGGGAWRWRPGRHRYGNDAFESGRSFKTDLGTLESGRSYSLLFQVRLPVAAATETEVARVSLRVPTRDGPRTFEALVTVPRHTGEMTVSVDRDVEGAREVLQAIGTADPKDQLRALQVRRKLYVDERRDPDIIAALDRAITEIEQKGSLSALSAQDQATILSHTCSVGTMRPNRREVPV